MWKFLVLFLPLAALLTALFVAFQHFWSRAELAALEVQERFHVEMGAKNLSRDFEILGSDLLVVAGSETLTRFVNENTSQARKGVEDRFFRFAMDRKLYDQIRYLDETGKEIVRVNYNNGNPQIMPQSQLQSKTSRYYFAETMALPRGGIFISPLDLNVERGAVEKPYKPIIRISKPVFDRFGKKKGIVILNYLAGRLSERLEAAQIGFAGEIHFLNEDGHWFLSPKKEDEWGFMFGNQRSFAAVHPKEWERISGALAGQFHIGYGLYTFNTFFPKMQIQRAASIPIKTTGKDRGSGRETDLVNWKIVSRVYPFDVGIFGQLVNQPLVSLFYFSLMVLLAFVCWRLAVAMVRRKGAEEALRSSEERWRGFASASFEGLLIHNNGVILEANENLADMFGSGVEALKGTHIQELVTPSSSERMRENLMQVSGTFETVACRKDGSFFPIELSVRPIAFMGKRQAAVAIRDLSERKQAEEKIILQHEQLIQADKMASLGTLVSGVAHEINNPNAIIALNTPSLREFWKDALPVLDAHQASHGDFTLGSILYNRVRDDIPAMLDDLQNGTDRIKTIVQNLKNFARRGDSGERCTISLNKVVESAVALVRARIRKATDHFRLALAEDLPMVEANFQELEQVVINLLTNSCDALADQGKAITISTVFDSDIQQAIIVIADEGEGITQENLGRIKEPFFTTKQESGGTGLGLSVSHGIIEDHNGSLEFTSSPGSGTVATLALPIRKR